MGTEKRKRSPNIVVPWYIGQQDYKLAMLDNMAYKMTVTQNHQWKVARPHVWLRAVRMEANRALGLHIACTIIYSRECCFNMATVSYQSTAMVVTKTP